MIVYKAVKLPDKGDISGYLPWIGRLDFPNFGIYCRNFRYRLGEKSFSPPDLGPLFAFKTFEDSYNFIMSKNNLLDSSKYYAILECKAKIHSKQHKKISESGFLKEFWKSRKNKKSYPHGVISVPQGTIFCDWIEPVRVIQYM